VLTEKTEPGLVSLYDFQPWNGVGLCFQPWSLHRVERWTDGQMDGQTDIQYHYDLVPFCGRE